MADIAQININNTDYNFADDTKVPYDLLQDTVGFTSKNLIPFPYVQNTYTASGVTFTVNADGSVTVNGTSTSWASMRLTAQLYIPAGNYKLSGGIGTGIGSVQLANISGESSLNIRNFTGETDVTFENGRNVVVNVVIESGKTFSNTKFYPMLRKADIMDDTYEQYNPSVKQVLRNNKIIEGKNLIPYPYFQNTPRTHNGITFTVNADTSITLNGTATADANINLFDSIPHSFFVGKEFILTSGNSNIGNSASVNDKPALNLMKNKGNEWSVVVYSDTGKFTVPSNVLNDNDYRLYIQIFVKSGITVSNFTIYPMLRLATETDPTYEQYYVPGVVSQEAQNILGAKNLIKYPYDDTTKTTGGVTFTDNGDGSITVSGTATEDINYFLFRQTTINRNTLLNKRLKLTGGINNNIHFYFYNVDGTNSVDDAGNGVEFNFTNASANFNIVLAIRNGTVISTPITIYPMLRLAEIQDDTWTPYARTNKDLTDNIFIKRELLNVDLNDITDYGMYSIQTGVTNSPESITYATLIVGPGSSVMGSPTRTQMVYKTQNLYVRTKAGSPAVWSPWYKFTGTEVSS